MFGFLNIYKPYGMTSHDVINKLRRCLKIKKIGHGGTLDPLAEGVLPVAVGGAARLIDFLPEDKEYLADFKLGVVSESFDTETELKKYSDKRVSKDEIEKELLNFKGEIRQKPPIYSAVKVGGQKLYQIARNGETAEIPERTVFINSISLTEFDEQNQTGKLLIGCSKGTYIRSLLNDLGQNLGTGAVMSGLIRTKSGGMSVSNAVKLDELLNADSPERYIFSVSEILNFPEFQITEKQYERVKNGNEFSQAFQNGHLFLKYKSDVIALGEAVNNTIKIRKVFI
ncbi:MAG: tRNA pseudouridine(55) synthase TruB [Candidatus Gastranaerophilales bacterium]|nr:tRNA pseudouridine(55) synthase TruB [Candidatus Gastranaerophilales bacterium]